MWNLPTVFICENNKYGMGTSAERSSSNTAYFTRGDKIPGLQVNGMDIIATTQAIRFARKWAIDEDRGPLLLEFVTYRYGGHSYVCYVVIWSKTLVLMEFFFFFFFAFVAFSQDVGPGYDVSHT